MEPDIAVAAALFGDPARAAMLSALLDRSSLSAGQLAFAANVSPQTASFHLSKLTSAALLISERHGRRQVYRLAGNQVAAVIESLAAISPRLQPPERFGSESRCQIRAARTCYDHLAGVAGVLLHDSVLKSGYLDRNYALTREGRRWLAASNLSAEPTRSPFARPCLDWTEQRPHLAGRLAAQMLQSFFQLGWIARIRDTRAVRVTDRGLREFERQYGLNLRKPV